MTIPQALALAIQHHQVGRIGEAEALYGQILTAQPDHAEALHFLGVIAHQTGHLDLALERIRQALLLDPNNFAAHFNLGEVYRSNGQFDEALSAYQRTIELKPDYVEVHNHLGNILRERNQIDGAIASYRRALELRPDYPEAHNNLGSALTQQSQLAEAVAEFRRALQLKPDYVTAHYNLGIALAAHDQLDEAIAAFRRTLQLQPDHPEAHNNLGNALKDRGQLAAAIAAYRQALELRPDYAIAYYNLGIAQRAAGQLDEALASYRRALDLDPSNSNIRINLGNTLKEQGRLDEAIATYRHALTIDPTQPDLHSNLIYALHLQPGLESRAIIEEQRRWNRQFSEPLGALAPRHTNQPDPQRRLKIGYVSPDFRSHPVSFFLVPLLEAHDHEQFEIYCYASLRGPDAVSERLHKSADVWREVRTYSDAQLAECIRNDGIDILVDLAMHTGRNRLPAFARKPAPVQVSWLAYPGSTGVEAIDYRLTDAHLDPSDQKDDLPGGQAMRLPDSWCCYAPIAEFPPISPLPATLKGVVTFGSLNQFSKIHDGLLHCWARLLKAVPASRLLMVCPDGLPMERTRALFAPHGIAAERLELVAHGSWADYVRLFERIDLALDSYPCNGMTTTCHSLWMGAPVVTLAGMSPISRAGESLLQTVGLPEWIAKSEEEYIRIATEWANDLPRLAQVRGTLRPRMEASPLMDAPSFARHIETAYRTMWQSWCSRGL